MATTSFVYWKAGDILHSQGWNHLPVPSLTCLVLGWFDFKARTTDWSTYMWHLHGAWASSQHGSLSEAGLLTWLWISSEQGRSCITSYDSAPEVTQHYFPATQGEGKLILPPNSILASLHCRKECGTGEIFAAFFERFNLVHSPKLPLLRVGEPTSRHWVLAEGPAAKVISSSYQIFLGTLLFFFSRRGPYLYLLNQDWFLAYEMIFFLDVNKQARWDQLFSTVFFTTTLTSVCCEKRT